MERIALFNDSYQNWKGYEIPKAQLILTDLPYQLGNKMYGSNPMWYEGGDIPMAKVNMREKMHLIQIQKAVLELVNFSISAITF